MNVSLPNVLDVDTLSDLVARQVPITILDVRTPAEYEAAHIPGSYNVPLDQLPEHASALGSAIGEPAILVCRSGARARQAEQALRRADCLACTSSTVASLPGRREDCPSLVVGNDGAWNARCAASPARSSWRAARRLARLAPAGAPRRRSRWRAGLLRDDRHLWHGAAPGQVALQPRLQAAMSEPCSRTWRRGGRQPRQRQRDFQFRLTTHRKGEKLMIIDRVYTPGLAQVAYLVADEAPARCAVIDPRRDIDAYLEWAASAACVSPPSSRPTSTPTSSVVRVNWRRRPAPRSTPVGWAHTEFPHVPLDDGDEIRVGALVLRALWTPGHTPEHIAYLLIDPCRGERCRSRSSRATSSFAGEIGRPDLLGPEAQKQLIEQLYDTVEQRLKPAAG